MSERSTLAHDETSLGPITAAEIRARLEPRRDEMVAMLRELVEIESPTDHRPGLDAVAERLISIFERFGSIRRDAVGPNGASHLIVDVEGSDPSAAHAVILCHYDTVWSVGTLERMPFAVDDQGIARGPGSFDMKGGIVLLAFALAELRALGRRPKRKLRILLSCDEEVRSATARPIIREITEGASAALVLESPLPGGALKTARKGANVYHVHIQGKAAHAGVEPEKGIDAVEELAHQILAIRGLDNRPIGTTVNVGAVRGGTRSNVVAAEAEAHVDVRAALTAEIERVDRVLMNLQPTMPGAVVKTVRDLGRPPMERTEASGRIFERARAIAAAIGMPDLGEGMTGGASDGNLTSAMGVPTIDGLGPEGAGAHADHEQVIVESLPRRAALLAGLLAEI